MSSYAVGTFRVRSEPKAHGTKDVPWLPAAQKAARSIRSSLIMGSMNTKQEILQALAELPDEANVVDALERLYLLYKIDKGIKQADAGELVTQDEARRRTAKWLK